MHCHFVEIPLFATTIPCVSFYKDILIYSSIPLCRVYTEKPPVTRSVGKEDVFAFGRVLGRATHSLADQSGITVGALARITHYEPRLELSPSRCSVGMHELCFRTWRIWLRSGNRREK